MCGSASDDPSMHNMEWDEASQTYIGGPVDTIWTDELFDGTALIYQLEPAAAEQPPKHNHPDVERWVTGCPACEYGAIVAERWDHNREGG